MDNVLTIDGVRFPVKDASFRTHGKTWDLEVNGSRADVEPGSVWWGLDPRLYTEAAPLALDPAATRSVFAMDLPEPSDGEWLFMLYVHEHEWVTSCRGVLSRMDDGYHFQADGTASIMGAPCTFKISTRMLRLLE